jgi:VanZ family protein
VPKKAYLFFALLWTAVIVVLCLISFNDLPSVKVQNADKYVHATFYFIFTMLWYLFLRNEDRTQSNLKTLVKVLAMAFVFGGAIEISQGLFTETRSADIMDEAANFSGALLAAILLFCYRKWIKKAGNNKIA